MPKFQINRQNLFKNVKIRQEFNKIPRSVIGLPLRAHPKTRRGSEFRNFGKNVEILPKKSEKFIILN
jgi:hypothetical protein